MSAGDRYTCLVDRAEKQYGEFTPELALDLMARGVSMKSNMHNALFKPATLELWVANSTIHDPACNLPYTNYDLKKLMSIKPGS
jgi:isopenicillin-N N-acyltransferase like protein